MSVPIISPAAGNIARAVRLLLDGQLIAFPTETVYGLAGDATNQEAVSAIFGTKGRPPNNPLIIHVADLNAARQLAVFDARAELLAQTFWPGPLTIVLPRGPGCAVVSRASAGLPTIALRIPDHPVALAVLGEFDRPVAAPSANPSGQMSPTTAQHVADHLTHGVAVILDGGPCRIGLESTVIGLTDARAVLLRPGGITRSEIETLIGPLAMPATTSDTDAKLAPGLLSRHYAPSRPLRLNAIDVQAGEALLAFGQSVPVGAAILRNLSPSGTLTEAAANLFAMLRDLDQDRFTSIAVMPIPESGLGLAINDRLRRAAASEPPLVADQ
ncbi:MAG: L-threonylcarbamoyladenylate synthase [Proteobacteria bacterium]|nr:L-threonylcarbamoyladenylate synthase [Pseudomonadota bacterium]